ncbi:hypothetical protein GGS20DRAFT_168424 [Poronia punctata]|nr:hypothetical protein GGS20DRAFT_168424 [Poronia punctata]
MLDLLSWNIGSKTWTKATNMVRRITQNRSRPIDEEARLTHQNTSSSSSHKSRSREQKEKDKLPLAVSFLLCDNNNNDDPTTHSNIIIHRQSASPLFAKLPPELREIIWEYALARYYEVVPHEQYPLDDPSVRPGQAAPLRVAVELLLTCRAVYVEAFLTPFRVNPVMVFDGHPYDVPQHNVLQCTPANLRSCRKLRPWQFANVGVVEMCVQQYTLEGGSVERVSRLLGNKGRHEGHEARGITLAGYASFQPAKETKPEQLLPVTESETSAERVMLIRSIFAGQKIKNLTIRMSRTDWWSWASQPQENPHERLRLEPMMNITDRRDASSAMVKGYEARLAGREPDFDLDEFEKQGRWGMQFEEYWPDLERLVLDLEMYAIKEDQLDAVIRCAKLWTFPLGDNVQLEWDGRKESVVRWRGADRYGVDDELGIWWPGKKPKPRMDDTSFIKWFPELEGVDQTKGGQEFVVKSLVFTRRRRQ